MRKLLEVLHRLADLGNSVIIIEHNLDVIRNADWILDLGPEGGEDGGRIVGEGRPASIASTPGSYTGQFLSRYYTSSDGKLMAAESEPELIIEASEAVSLLARASEESAPSNGKRTAATKTSAKKHDSKRSVASKKAVTA